MAFTKKKFLRLGPLQQHKKCAEHLRLHYENKLSDFSEYNTFLSWLQFLPFEPKNRKELADRYHWHLQMAGLSLKEHNLLPSLRTQDREPKLEFAKTAIYLDHVRSAYNVGSILRTVEALRIGSVYFSEKTPFIDHEKVQKTAMGSASIVPCYQNIPLASLPRPLIAFDTSESAISIEEFEFPPTFTLILGNEEYGISEASLKEADYVVEIPLFGKKNSINIACAFSIAAAKIRFSKPKSFSRLESFANSV